MIKKTYDWLTALTLLGLLVFLAVPAFADGGDAVFTYKNDCESGTGIITVSVSYGPAFNSQALSGNVTFSRVKADGTRTPEDTHAIFVDPADPSHRTLTVKTNVIQRAGIFELRIKPGAIAQSPLPPKLYIPSTRH